MAKPKNKKCVTKFCRGVAYANAHSNKCAKCRSRQFAKNHPIAYAFSNLRNRAKQRGHVFKLTYAEYRGFWLSNGFDEKHGKEGFCLSIDRIKGDKGYVIGNVQAITLSLNSRKEYVPFFKNKKDEEAAVKLAERKAEIAQEVEAELASKGFIPETDEWLTNFTAWANARFEQEGLT